MQYQCCFCQEIFPATSAIDGFSLGYKTGFLCPYCQRNLQDDFVSTRTVYQKKDTAVYVKITGSLLIGTAFLLSHSSWANWMHFSALFAAMAVTFIYGYLRYGDDIVSTTITTQPGPGINRQPDDAAHDK